MTKKTDTKEVAATAKEVVVIEKRFIGQPGVIAIGGTILEPAAQVDKVNGHLTYNGVLLTDYNFDLVGDRSAKLSIYTYRKVGAEDKTTELFIVADELSSLDIPIPSHLDFQDEAFAVITLVNSSSSNDFFRGSTVLANVESEHNAFHDSIIELHTIYYGESRAEAMKKQKSRRIPLKGVDASKLRFQGRQLPPGYYYDSELYNNTFIRGEKESDNREVRIRRSELRWNNFREGDIDIENSTVSNSGFHFSGNVKLDGVKLHDEHFGKLPGLYLASAFDLTRIDVAGALPARMIRVDADNVIVTLPKDEGEFRARMGGDEHVLIKMSFRNPQSRRALRRKAMEVLFGDDMPSEMEESVMDYLADTILSRCSMINLVDSAKRLLSNKLVGVKDRPQANHSVPGLPFISPRVAEVYGTDTSVANEYDRTIYIDGQTLDRDTFAGKF